ncbi:MAG: hypothetical protein PVG03_05680 [Desulfarculaceae bacterium]|jgi:hypothetical protein
MLCLNKAVFFETGVELSPYLMGQRRWVFPRRTRRQRTCTQKISSAAKMTTKPGS